VCFRLEDPAPAHHWLDRLGLEPLRRARPGTLSGGQKQRVALACALAHGPSLLLLDEPLSNLDAAFKDSLRHELRGALKSAGVPSLWVTHDQGEALSMGDQVGVLRDGVLQQIDTPQRCYCEPANRFVAEFLGEASFVPGYLAAGTAVTALGSVPATSIDGAQGDVDVLLRPDDCSLGRTADGVNGEVRAAQYEGGTWLYTVALDDGVVLRVRTSHENRVEAGERVTLAVTSNHPLAVFARS